MAYRTLSLSEFLFYQVQVKIQYVNNLSDPLIKNLINHWTDIRNAFKENGTYGFAPIYEVCMRSGPAMLFMTETTNCMNRLLSCSWAGCTPSFTAKVVDPYGNLSMTLTNSGVGCSCCLSSNKVCSIINPYMKNTFKQQFH